VQITTWFQEGGKIASLQVAWFT